MNTTTGARVKRPPKYEVLAEALQGRLAGMHPHDGLPTERELMAEFTVSRMTVRQALSRLIARGLVYNVQGSGTYVADPAVVLKSLRLTGFSEDMRRRGLTPSSRVLAVTRAPASAETARRLDVGPGTELVAFQRLRLANESPMALETVQLAAALMDPLKVDLTVSLYEQLEHHGVRVIRAAQTIAAVNLDPDQARHLEQAVGAAALRVNRVSFSTRGRPVEYAETIYRGDRYSYDLVVSRDS